MNNKEFENKLNQDAARVEKGIHTIVEDSADRLGTLKKDVVRAADNTKDDLSMWAKDSASQIGNKVEKITNNIKEAVSSSTEMVKEDVSQGLSQYNAKAQELANKIPGGFGEKVIHYPWVALSITLVFGLLLGSFIFKPRRRRFV